MRSILLLLLVSAGVLVLGRFDLAQLQQLLPAAIPRSAEPTPIAAPSVVARPQVQPKPGEVAVEVSEAELSDRLTRQFAGEALGQTPLGTATIERVDVSLRGGQAGLGGNARVGSASVPYSARLNAAPSPSGQVKVTLTDARVSGVPLPDPVRAQLESTVQGEIDRLILRQPMRVRSIEIEGGRLRAVGTPGA